MGSQTCEIVGKSQPVLIMINPIIFTRTRMGSRGRCGCSGVGHQLCVRVCDTICFDTARRRLVADHHLIRGAAPVGTGGDQPPRLSYCGAPPTAPLFCLQIRAQLCRVSGLAWSRLGSRRALFSHGCLEATAHDASTKYREISVGRAPDLINLDFVSAGCGRSDGGGGRRL
jgi:hypothetical protein